jgi:hypothetical protein
MSLVPLSTVGPDRQVHDACWRPSSTALATRPAADRGKVARCSVSRASRRPPTQSQTPRLLISGARSDGGAGGGNACDLTRCARLGGGCQLAMRSRTGRTDQRRRSQRTRRWPTACLDDPFQLFVRIDVAFHSLIHRAGNAAIDETVRDEGRISCARWVALTDATCAPRVARRRHPRIWAAHPRSRGAVRSLPGAREETASGLGSES